MICVAIADPGFCGGMCTFVCPTGSTCADINIDDCHLACGGRDCAETCIAFPEIPECGIDGICRVSSELMSVAIAAMPTVEIWTAVECASIRSDRSTVPCSEAH